MGTETRRKRQFGKLFKVILILCHSIDPDKNTCLIDVVADYKFYSGSGSSNEASVCLICLVVCSL